MGTHIHVPDAFGDIVRARSASYLGGVATDDLIPLWFVGQWLSRMRRRVVHTVFISNSQTAFEKRPAATR